MSMDIDRSVPIASLAQRKQQPATILCCNCGAPIDGTNSAGALCHDCLKLTVDITHGIQREATLQCCRDCDRWMSPPSSWVAAAPESRELLALCLRKLRGLSKTRIIDASFVWTEPHSRRIRVKISIQQDPFNEGTIIQQTFEVEYVVASHQCPDCAKSYTHNTWRANVQVRQKVPHKRTFLYLEQLILKNNAHRDTINIKEVHQGLDFYFAQRNQAEKFVEFLTSVVPCRTKKSQQLISMDVHTSAKSYKFSFSVELVPVCKDDLVALPLKLAAQLGQIAPLTLCSRVGTAVQVLDPATLQTAEIQPAMFWRDRAAPPFRTVADARSMTEFTVMDIEPLGPVKGRWVLADATVRRTTDLGANDVEYTVRTHLGGILHPGDAALGYYLTGANFNNPFLEAIEKSKDADALIPDVMLVRKVYPRRKKNKNRNWKLKRMAAERGEELEEKKGRRTVAQTNQDQEEMDYEMFLRDVEEDAELRESLNVYKAQQKRLAKAQKMEGIVEGEADVDAVEAQALAAKAAADQQRARAVQESGVFDEEGEDEGDEEEDEGDGLEIPMDELRDEFEDMTMEE